MSKDVQDYINELRKLRTEGKHEEAELLKKRYFGVLYGMPVTKHTFKKALTVEAFNYGDMEARLLAAYPDFDVDINVYFNSLLPPWAVRKSDGNYRELHAQLCTRDGRRCGNAVVTCIDEASMSGAIVVTTDVGNKMTLTEGELKELFYPPTYIMDITYDYTKDER